MTGLPDVIRPARGHAFRSVVFSAIITAVAGAFLWLYDGWTSWIAVPALLLGGIALLDRLSDWLGEVLLLSAEGRRVVFLVALVMFLLGASSYILWVMRFQCVDCSSPFGWALAAFILVTCWGVAGVLLRQVFKARRRAVLPR